MSLTKSKCWYSNNFLHFLKCAISLGFKWSWHNKVQFSTNLLSHEVNYLYYCIWGLSETTGASSDVYYHSNNDDDIRVSCAFYVESIQVKWKGDLAREYRERERDIADWERGRERKWRERERHGFKSRSTFSWSNQHKVFLDIANSHVNTEIILRQCK